MVYHISMISPSFQFLLLISFASGVLAAENCNIMDSKCGSITNVVIAIIAIILIIAAIIVIRAKKTKAVKDPYTIESTSIAPSSISNHAILAKYKDRNRSVGEPSAPSRVVVSIPLFASERNITLPYSSYTLETPSSIPSNDYISYPPPYHAETRPPKYY